MRAKNSFNSKLLAVLFVYVITNVGCHYSFTGSSVPPHLKTIAIALFDDQSGFGEPGLRENLTNKLIEKFIQDNSLEIADKTHSDSMLRGTIVAVRDNPSVVSQGEAVTKRRITITVRASYQDMKLKKTIWEKDLTSWGDYEISGGPAQRITGIEEAMKKLSEDMLLETVSGW